MPLRPNEQAFLDLIAAARPLSWGEGLWAPLRAIGYIFTHPRVLVLCLAPWLINLFILTPLVLLLGFAVLFPWLASFVPIEATFHGASLAFIWRWFLVIFIAGIGLLVFFAGAMILGAPFHEAASAAIEHDRLAGRPELWARNDIPFFDGVWISMLGKLKRLLIVLPRFALVLLIGFIPFIGWSIAWVLNAFFQARFLTLEAFSVPLDRRGITLDAKWTWLRRQRAFAVGFGVPCLLIPFSFFLLPPIATVAATLLTCDVLERVPPEKTRVIAEVIEKGQI
jgi:CysZ protein